MGTYTNDARVAVVAMGVTKDKPEEDPRWMSRFEAAAPDNGLANYLVAFDCLDSGQLEQGLRELQAASRKPRLDEYWFEISQTIEQAYRDTGYSDLEAKLGSLDWSRAMILPGTRHLSDKLVEVASSYRQAGDAAAAQAVMESGLTFSQRLADPSRWTLVEYLYGLNVQDRLLATMDPDSRVGSTGQTAGDMRSKIAAIGQIVARPAKAVTVNAA